MLKKFLFLFVTSAVCSIAPVQSQEKEANLKAAFIYNFTKYIDWENDGNGDDFVIAVIGNSPVTGALNEIAKKFPAKNKKIIVRVYENPEDIGYSNILFIPQKTPFLLHSILEKVDKGTLTVSEETGFAVMGTAFNFVIIKDKLKFEANLKAIYSAGLKAGSQLLKLAIIVD